MKPAELKEIPVENIVPGKFQPRQSFSEHAIRELSDSIKAQGLIQPIVVRPIADDKYEIIAGERRWRAVQLAGLSEINCLIYHYHDEAAAAVSLIENLSRDDLNPIEVALGYQRLIDEFDYLQEEVATACGVSRSKVSNALRLLTLASEVQSLLIEKKISDGHGKVLAGYSHEIQKEYAKLILRHHWSVRKLEEQLNRLKTMGKKGKQQASLDVLALERSLSEQLNTDVSIDTQRNQGGTVKIRFYDNDTLAGILDKLELEY